jgi:hypothetical protein
MAWSFLIIILTFYDIEVNSGIEIVIISQPILGIVVKVYIQLSLELECSRTVTGSERSLDMNAESWILAAMDVCQ